MMSRCWSTYITVINTIIHSGYLGWLVVSTSNRPSFTITESLNAKSQRQALKRSESACEIALPWLRSSYYPPIEKIVSWLWRSPSAIDDLSPQLVAANRGLLDKQTLCPIINRTAEAQVIRGFTTPWHMDEKVGSFRWLPDVRENEATSTRLLFGSQPDTTTHILLVLRGATRWLYLGKGVYKTYL